MAAAVVADELVLLIRSEVSDAIAGLNTVERKAETTGSKLGRVGDKMSSIGTKMTLGVTLPVVGAGIAMFNFASDADESASKAATVFGDAFAAVDEAANNAADAFSRQEFHDMAGTMGNILSALGFTRDEMAGMSVDMLGLAQDLSSFNNVPVEQAVGAITSALTGEREALKSLGIVINEEMVKQKALEMGLWNGTDAMDAQTKALATQALMFEGAGAAVGDFERTSDGAANQTKIVMANFKDLAAELGQKLIPIGSKLIEWAGKAVDFFTNMPEPLQNVIMVVAGLAAALGPVLMVVGKLLGPFGKLISLGKFLIPIITGISAPVWGVIAAIAAAIAIGYLIWRNWDTIWNAIKAVTEAVWGAIQAFFDLVLNSIKALVETVFNAIKAYFEFVFNLYKTIFETAWNVIKAVVEFVVNLIKTIIESVFNAIKAYIEFTLNLWKTIFETVWNAIVTVVTTVVDAIKRVIETVFNFIKGFIERSINGWKRIISTVLGAIKGVFSTVWNGIKAVVMGVWNTLTGFVSRAINGWKRILSNGFNLVKDAVLGIWDGMVSGLKNGIKGAVNFIIDKINWLIRKINSGSGFFNKIPGVSIPMIPEIPNLGFGGADLAGSFRVGDRGLPEIVNLPAGSSVTPLRPGANGGSGDIHVHLNAPQNDPHGIAREVGWELTKRGLA